MCLSALQCGPGQAQHNLALALTSLFWFPAPRNPDYAVLLKPDSLADPGKCPLPDPALQGAGRRRLLKRNEGEALHAIPASK